MTHTPRVPLDQANYAMRIIEDLGVLHKPHQTRPTRFAIFECTVCKKHIEANAYNAKSQLYCQDCKRAAQKQAITKPLDPADYTMRIIEDLGTQFPTPTSTRAVRFAIFECTTCSTYFKARATGLAAKSQTQCQACTRSPDQLYKHPLYAIWNGIKQRCYSPKRKDYPRYGGIGVTMAEEWKNDSSAFITWCLEHGWTEDLEVDKDIKCNELNITPAIYSPDTISFVTPSRNAREATGRQIDKLTLDGAFIESYASAIDAAEAIDAPSGDTITNVCKGRALTSYGFKWRYSVS